MLAKCPNTVRVLRLLNFGKQKFFNALSRLNALSGRHFCAREANFVRRQPWINALYRWQYSLGADFAKNATLTRLRKS